MKTYHSFSSDETKKLGEFLARKTLNHSSLILNQRGALVLALQGDLGAGKTTFAQGFFKGLGIKRRAVSPTFVIMRRYKIPANRELLNAKRKTSNKLSVMSDKRSATGVRFTQIYHFDAYRLKKAEDLGVLEFDDIIANPKNIILIEWPERIKEILLQNTVWLKFRHGKKENERIIQANR